jgi:hypothetical protein
MKDLKEHMEADYEEFVASTLNQAIDMIKLDPDYFYEINHLYPFNKKEFADVDWSKVSHARLENHSKIILIMNDDE